MCRPLHLPVHIQGQRPGNLPRPTSRASHHPERENPQQDQKGRSVDQAHERSPLVNIHALPPRPHGHALPHRRQRHPPTRHHPPRCSRGQEELERPQTPGGSSSSAPPLDRPRLITHRFSRRQERQQHAHGRAAQGLRAMASLQRSNPKPPPRSLQEQGHYFRSETSPSSIPEPDAVHQVISPRPVRGTCAGLGFQHEGYCAVACY